MNDLIINEWSSHFKWIAFAASEQTSLDQSKTFTITQQTSNIQRTLYIMNQGSLYN